MDKKQKRRLARRAKKQERSSAPLKPDKDTTSKRARSRVPKGGWRIVKVIEVEETVVEA